MTVYNYNSSDSLTVKGFAVDDDTIGLPLLMPECHVPFATAACKDWGEWSLGETTINVGPGVNESYTKSLSVHAYQGDGDVNMKRTGYSVIDAGRICTMTVIFVSDGT